MDDGPLIVVSDTHFGFKPESAKVFGRFMEWLTRLETDGSESVAMQKGQKKTLKKAQKIILLGDIFDFLFPRTGDMTNPLRDGFTIFDRLFRLPCEKIYVSGNHDEDIASYKGTYFWDNTYKFDVVHGHYPEDPRLWLKVGKRTYFFLHGYQFDQVFESSATRKGLEIWARLSSASAELDPWIVPTGSSLFLLSLLRRNWIRLARTAPSIVAIPVLFIWFVLWIIFGVSVLAWVGRRLQDLFYRTYPDHLRYEREPSRFERLTGNARLVNIDDLVERHYYKKHMDTTTADVIVFGHTHVPQRPTRPPHAEKTFVNTGSWVPSRLYTYNTFVYIDDAGPLLLQWCDNTKTVREVPPDKGVIEL